MFRELVHLKASFSSKYSLIVTFYRICPFYNVAYISLHNRRAYWIDHEWYRVKSRCNVKQGTICRDLASKGTFLLVEISKANSPPHFLCFNRHKKFETSFQHNAKHKRQTFFFSYIGDLNTLSNSPRSRTRKLSMGRPLCSKETLLGDANVKEYGIFS